LSTSLAPRFRLGRRRHVMHPAFRAPRDFPRDLADALGGRRVVTDDLVDLVSEEVACGALDESGFLEDAGRRRIGLAARLDVLPLVEQHREIAHEVARAGALGDRAHDDAHAFRHRELLHNLAQPRALLGVLDLA